MAHRRFALTATALLVAALLAVTGCSTEDPAVDTSTGTDSGADDGTGRLVFVADGEEHAREGTISKEGWAIVFEHAYVTVFDVTAYQTDPPYDPDTDGWDPSFDHVEALPGVFTIDLADPDSGPAVIGEAPAAAGRYNALSWSVVRAPSGPAEGYSMVFSGTAEKDGEVVEFTLRFDRETAYLGGEYIGDVRKGILEPGGEAQLEMTFHFDHFFGRDDKDADDPINVAALGFEPLAALAVDGRVDVGIGDLEELLTAEEYAKLEAILVHFGHVGEGHCIARPL